MDLFGRKQVAKLLKELRTAVWCKEIAEHNYNVACKERDALIKTLQDQDQLIWTMSQQPSWERMRPHLNQLQAGTETRMRLESDRIRDVLIPEVRKAYSPPNPIHSLPNETTAQFLARGNGTTVEHEQRLIDSKRAKS